MGIVTVLLLHALSGWAQGLPSDVRILRTGTFHRNEISPADSGSWLALVPGGSHSRLIPLNVTVKPVHDPIDDDTTSLNGRLVLLDSGPEPIALFRADFLAPGEVTAYTGEPLEIPFGGSLDIGGATLTLSVSDSTVVDRQRQYRFDLTLQTANTRERVASYTGYTDDGRTILPAAERYPRVLWAGDLDRDGRVDFLLDTSDHYNVEEMTLFLSSPAKAGEPVRAAGKFRATGC